MKKYPITLQQSAMDCGVACISMVLQSYGLYYSIPELKEYCRPTHEGVSMKAVAETLEQLGFRTMGGRVPVETLRKAQLPIILHWEQNHFFFLSRRKVLNYELFKANSASNTVTYQIVNAMQEAKLQGCTQRRRWEWEDAKARQFDVSIRSLKLSQVQEIGSFFINQTTNLFITFMTVTAVIDGHITLGTMLAIQYIIGQLSSPVHQIIGLVYNVQDVRISLERINEIKDKKDENEQCRTVPARELQRVPIVVEHLNFKYEGTYRNVLNDICLTIQSGATTAIVGSSGSGKTTLLKLLLQYYPSYEGRIGVGEHELRTVNRDQWRDLCSVVMLLIGIVLLLVALAFFIELPDTAGLTKNGENLRLIDLLIMP